MNPLTAQVAAGGIQFARSIATAVPELIGRGASTFGDLLSQRIDETPTSDGTTSLEPREMTDGEVQTRRETDATTRVLQERIESILKRHGIEFGAGMSLQLSEAGRLRVEDHPQAAHIESIIQDDPELKQLVVGLLTSAQLQQAGSASNNLPEPPALDELTIRLQPKLS
ncbi:MAG: hypothetical protein O3A00_20875 [Planctomycetota bacterium]|nr:hypothetical protein [Planctomycetota bacterium]